MKTVMLPSGEHVPALGQGAWQIGDNPATRSAEIAALQLGLDLGLTLIDTAEMYGNGRSEEVVGEAIRGRRDEVFLVSKVLPYNATRRGTIAACEESLQRLQTDRLDLYLLHWPGAVPLVETLAAFTTLVQTGKIRHWGVSNFDTEDMQEVVSLPGGADVATNQVLYNPSRRGIEWDLVPWCLERRIPLMAYSPIEQGRLLGHPVLAEVATRHNATAAQIALAWVLQQDQVIAIPKAGKSAHVQENRAALDIRLTEDDLAALDRALPPPARKQPLEML